MGRRLRSILTDDFDTCYLCGKTLGPGMREIHHVFGGANRDNSEKYGLIVPLCHDCHNEPPLGVHHNKGRRLKLQAEAQNEFEKEYSSAEFMGIFGRDYIETYKAWREEEGLV